MKYLNIISFVLLCGYGILFTIDGEIGAVVFLLTHWIFFACAIWALYALLDAFSNKTKASRAYRYTIIVSLVAVIVTFAVCFAQDRSKVGDIRRNYDEHETEIESFVKSMDGLLFPNTNITLEFENGKKSIFHVTDSLNQRHSNWNKDAVANKDSLMIMSGLSESEYLYIKKSLTSSHCIGIETHIPDYCDVWCLRVGMGKYSYRVYLRPLSEEEQTYYLKSNYHCIPYNDHVLFMYDSSVGRDTFTKKEREKYLNEFQWESKYYHGIQ